jgi:DNA-binding transcriptional MocR family regulator
VGASVGRFAPPPPRGRPAGFANGAKTPHREDIDVEPSIPKAAARRTQAAAMTALYVHVADEIAAQIRSGVLRPGERVPSVRRLEATRGVSKATVLKAYYLLEGRGLIASRPRSGYYVSAAAPPPGRADVQYDAEAAEPKEVDDTDLVIDYLDGMRARALVPFGSAFPSPHLMPLGKLARMVANSARQLDPWRTVEDLPPGNLELRRYIARRYIESGAHVDVDDVVITSSGAEAMFLSLQAVTVPGDTVAIGSPASYRELHMAAALGLRVVEVPVDLARGVDVDALERALDTDDVKACLFTTTFQNPTGATMPAERKRTLAAMLASRGIPLIEDDAFAELYFGGECPRPAKAFDRDGLVLHCGSFVSSLAPGYSVGWVAPGRYARHVRASKYLYSLSTNVIAQEAIAEFILSGAYERHLRRLRAALQQQQQARLAAIERHFPEGTEVQPPAGGYFLWVRLPGGVDTLALHRQLVREGIGIAPGPLFSAQRAYGSYLRLNSGHPWCATMEQAIATIGRLATSPPAPCAARPPR